MSWERRVPEDPPIPGRAAPKAPASRNQKPVDGLFFVPLLKISRIGGLKQLTG